MLQYLFARAWAERNGYELHHEPFIGEEVFDLGPVIRPDGRPTVRCNEDSISTCLSELHPHKFNIEFRGYALKQSCMVYTKRQAQQWLKVRPELLELFPRFHARIAAHLRHGDFIGYSYPALSRIAYLDAARYYGLDETKMVFLSEEAPLPRFDLPEHLSFLPDFVTMMTAHTLLRANSTFSWLAGLLSDGIVLSPRVEGLRGGQFHDSVAFYHGNAERLSDHDFVTRMEVAP